MAAPRSARVQSATVSSPKTVHVRSQSVTVFSPRPHPRPQPVHVREQSVSSPHPRRVHLRLRVNRPSIVWLAARRQGKTRPAAREFHLDDTRFAGRQTGL